MNEMCLTQTFQFSAEQVGFFQAQNTSVKTTAS